MEQRKVCKPYLLDVESLDENQQYSRREKSRQSKLYKTFFSDPTGVQFTIAVEDKIPQRKKRMKKAQRRTIRKDVCDICGTKTKSGHVKCKIRGQWKHIKCVRITIREAETHGYKCQNCK